jgi:16S rRNA processing protein RimM
VKKKLVIARIVGTHGIRGALKVISFAQSDAFFETDQKIRLTNAKGIFNDFTVKWSKPHKKLLLMALEGISDMNAAAGLVGNEIVIDRQNLPALQNGEFYWTDLIGLSVVSTDGKNVGKIETIFETGSNDVCVVKNDSQEALIPFIDSVVKSVDIEGKTMVVELPEGLP